MKQTVYLIHGFNVRDGGAQSTDLLAPLFNTAGYRVKELDYGFYGFFRTRFCNDSIAQAMAATLIPDSLVVAHSNGCDLVYRAAQHGAIFHRAILLNPALDKKKTIKNAKSVHVWHSPSDMWTLAARFRPASTWGSQGRDGYVGNDPRYTNFNEDEIFGSRVGHSGIFRHLYRLQAIAAEAIDD